MRTRQYEEHVRELRLRVRRYQFAQRVRRAHRPPRRRPRDPETLRNRIALARRRREAWLASGRLQRLGERHYRLNLSPHRIRKHSVSPA